MDQSAQQPILTPQAPQSSPMPQDSAKKPGMLASLKNKKNFIVIGVVVGAVLLGMIIAFTLLTKSPDRVLSSFIKASQARKVVSQDQFFDNQAEQGFAIVYKIPPKSFKIQKTTIEDKTATVEVEWTTIDSSRDYKERTDTVLFTLRKDGRAWKLDRVKQGDVVNFDFLFGN